LDDRVSDHPLLDQALDHHRAGRLNEALPLYQTILASEPQNAFVWNLLGALRTAQANYPLAVEHLLAAVKLDASQAPYYANLGETYRRWGRDAEAINCLRRALALDPRQVDALNNLGIIYQAQGKLREAADCYEQGLRIQPDVPEMYLNVGTLYDRLGMTAEAIRYFQRALQLKPDFATAYNNLAAILIGQLRYDEAHNLLEHCLRLKPTYAEAWNNRGSIEQMRGRFTAAIPYFQEAIKYSPAYLDALTNLASAQRSIGDLPAAEASFARAMELDGRDGLRIKAAFPLPPVLQSQAQIDPLRQRLKENLGHLAAQKLHVTDPIKELGHNHFYLAYHGLDDREFNVQIAELQRRACPALSFTAPHCQAPVHVEPRRPIRIGIVSSHLFMHSVGRLMGGIIAQLSRAQFHVTVVRLPSPSDDWSREIDASADAVLQTSWQLETAQQEIAQQKFDILLYADLGMDVLSYFLAFARLAPLQCVTWGHPVTTGISTIDYFLSAGSLEPEDGPQHYSEKLVLLSAPPTYLRPFEFLPSEESRADFGLEPTDHVYVCAQSLFKFHPEFDSMLARILEQDPRGKLVLIGTREPAWQESLLARFRQTMPNAWTRVHFVPRQTTNGLARLMQLADVVLDTTHFSGGLTTLEAFYVNQPVVTLPGRFMRGRVTYAYYRQMEMDDCVARDVADYVRLALRMANDRPWREQMQALVRERQVRLYENIGVVRELEEFLAKALQRA
jgi:predicted O-linked N-acetylglucosamine transferase (SPINDLY family)